MKMSRLEKRFVNAAGHSNNVAAHAEQLVATASPEPGQRLLEVGCGNGAAAIHLSRRYLLDLTGIDVDPKQIDIAATANADHASTRFLVADATRLPFPDGEFDLVYTNKTTHHIRDWQQALTEMIRVLKPGGQLLYSDFVAPLGRRFPTRRALNRLANEHGMQTTHTDRSAVRHTMALRKRT